MAELFGNYIYDYTRGTIMVYFSAMVNLEGAKYAAAVQNAESMESTRVGYCIFLLDGCHIPYCFEILRDENGLE